MVAQQEEVPEGLETLPEVSDIPSGICQLRPFSFYKREDTERDPKEGKSMRREYRDTEERKTTTSLQFIRKWPSLHFLLSGTLKSFKENI